MIVLGLDPGLAKFGFALVSVEGGRFRIIASGVLTTPPSQSVSERLAAIFRKLEALARRKLPDVIVIERIVPGPGRNLTGVAEARGVALLFAGQRRIPVEEIIPKSLKLGTTRAGSATKMQMRKTVQRIFGLPDLPPADAADALALTIFVGTGIRRPV